MLCFSKKLHRFAPIVQNAKNATIPVVTFFELFVHIDTSGSPKPLLLITASFLHYRLHFQWIIRYRKYTKL